MRPKVWIGAVAVILAVFLIFGFGMQLGNSPRTILEELARIQSHDVVLPTAKARRRNSLSELKYVLTRFKWSPPSDSHRYLIGRSRALESGFVLSREYPAGNPAIYFHAPSKKERAGCLPALSCSFGTVRLP
jgi:hypothetical protein